jgi:hypothetical protein
MGNYSFIFCFRANWFEKIEINFKIQNNINQLINTIKGN